jgi:hypothetical protein
MAYDYGAGSCALAASRSRNPALRDARRLRSRVAADSERRPSSTSALVEARGQMPWRGRRLRLLSELLRSAATPTCRPDAGSCTEPWPSISPAISMCRRHSYQTTTPSPRRSACRDGGVICGAGELCGDQLPRAQWPPMSPFRAIVGPVSHSGEALIFLSPEWCGFTHSQGDG